MKRLTATLMALPLVTSMMVSVLNINPAHVNAWATDQAVSAVCSDNNTIAFEYAFSNTEPDEDRWDMDVVVTDSNTSLSSEMFTVQAGETGYGTINTDLTEITSGTVTFELTWTDGRSGVDTRSANYDALTCEQPEEQIEVCRDGEVITIFESERLSTDTNPPCPVEQIEVCRDGVIITIDKDDRRETDTAAPCPEGKGELICRDGKELQVTENDIRPTDTRGECPEVLPATLPNTGAGSFAMTLASILGFSGLVQYAANKRNGLV